MKVFQCCSHERQIKKTYPDDGSVEWTYDGFNRKIMVTDNRNVTDRIGGTGGYAGTLAYNYDPLDRMVRKTDQDGYVVGYAYRGDGQKLRLDVYHADDPNATLHNVQYGFDEAGRLTVVISPFDSILDNWIAEFGYDANGNREQLSYYPSGNPFGSSVDMTYHYNKDNLLLGYETTGGPTFSMDKDTTVVDGLGRLRYKDETITRTNQATVDHEYTYNYDMLSQLKLAHITNVPPTAYRHHEYSYDKAGNLIQDVFNNGGPDFVDNYSHNGDQVVERDGTGGTDTVTWDLNGRQTSQVDQNPVNYPLEYDWDGRLREAEFYPDYFSRMRYTPDGVRIAKSMTNILDHKFVVDEVGDFPTILLILDPNDCCTRKTYVHANGQLLMQFDGDNTAGKYFYLHDRLGSVRALMDAAGDVANCYYYTPWGALTGQESQATVSDYFGFAGYYADTEIGQYHLFRRQYDYVLGRFTTRDPVIGSFREPRTLHAYLYVLNDPVNLTDPTGEAAVVPLAPIVVVGLVAILLFALIQAIEARNLRVDLLIEGLETNIESLQLFALTAPISLLAVFATDSRTADQIIQGDKKGSIRREFPGEMLGKTLDEIRELARKGDRAAKKALKLLTDKRFNKGS